MFITFLCSILICYWSFLFMLVFILVSQMISKFGTASYKSVIKLKLEEGVLTYYFISQLQLWHVMDKPIVCTLLCLSRLCFSIM